MYNNTLFRLGLWTFQTFRFIFLQKHNLTYFTIEKLRKYTLSNTAPAQYGFKKQKHLCVTTFGRLETDCPSPVLRMIVHFVNDETVHRYGRANVQRAARLILLCRIRWNPCFLGISSVFLENRLDFRPQILRQCPSILRRIHTKRAKRFATFGAFGAD